MTIGIDHLIHANVVCDDFDRSLDFYGALGYSVVGTVRSLAKTDYIKTLFKDAFEAGRLDFAVVEDITKDGAFDAVLKSRAFDVVLHTSSPFTYQMYVHSSDLNSSPKLILLS